MTVIVVTACPVGLRGYLTRWLLEIAPGVFVGTITARVRALLWEQVQEQIGRGRGLMVWNVRGEQRLDFANCGHDWEPVDFDGIRLMMRPGTPALDSGSQLLGPSNREGWSTAARRRRFRPDIDRGTREN